MSKIQVIECENGKKRFIDCLDENNYRASFARIEQLRPESNYYLLWREEDSLGFYLYNTAKGRYALTGTNSDSLTNSREFTKIESYSDNTKSFVAYRKDDGLAYLLYEDGDKGDIGERGESFIGEEQYGKRPVKNPKGEWVFVDCVKRRIVPHFKYKGHKQQLDRWLCDNHYVTKFENHIALSQYRERGSFKHVPGFFDEIWECSNDYIIASKKSHGAEEYVLVKSAEIIGTFVNRPTYDTDLALFKAKKENNQWYLFKKDIGITHYNWKEDNFKLFGKFILNKSSDRGWLIYDIKTGKHICQDWYNIRIDDKATYPSLLVDTDNLSNKSVSVDDVERHMNELIESCSKSYGDVCDIDALFSVQPIEIDTSIQITDNSDGFKEENEDAEEEINKLQNDTTQEIQVRQDYEPFYDFDCENVIPQDIKHIVFPQTQINVRRSFKSNLTIKNIHKADYVCWVFVDDNAIVITQMDNVFPKWHNCVFRKVYDKVHFINTEGVSIRSGFKSICLHNVDENTIIDEINKWLDKWRKEEKITKPSIAAEESIKSIPTIQSAGEILPVSADSEFSKSIPIDEGNGLLEKAARIGEVTLKDKSLSISDTISIKEIFGNKHYRILNDAIIILVDEINLVAIDYAKHLSRHYNIIGEGKDRRFPQDFNKNNKAIRDNDYPIFLFRKLDDNNCELIDQVVCYNYTKVGESHKVKVDEFKVLREVINFEFESLYYHNDRQIDYHNKRKA